jgi:hypothetical protein
MINNTVVVQLKLSTPKNPYNKPLTPNEKLRLFQVERTSIKKSLSYNIKDIKCLEKTPEVMLYKQACNVAGSGNVQQYLLKFQESKKLESRLSYAENDIKVLKTDASITSAFASGFNVLENYQCPVLDDDEAFASPCDVMENEEIDKIIENGKVPSIKAIVVMPATVTPKKTDVYNVGKQVPLTMQLNFAEPNDSQVDVVVGSTKCYESLTEEGVDPIVRAETFKALEVGAISRAKLRASMEGKISLSNSMVDANNVEHVPLPQLLGCDMVPKKVSLLHKRAYVPCTPFMDDDSSNDDSSNDGIPVIGTRAKVAAARAKYGW